MLAFWLTMDESYMHGIGLLKGGVTAGGTPAQPSMLTGTAKVCDDVVGEASMWALQHREGHRLLPDSMLADVVAGTGRRSVPPRVVATVMVCERLLGLSDREAVEAATFDARSEVRLRGPGPRLPEPRPHGARGHAGAPGPLRCASSHP